jgi:(2Fe-2S) ferredoxin
MPRYQRHIFVCINVRPPENPTGCCASKGAEDVCSRFKDELRRRKLKAFVRANKAGCLANCSEGVTVVVYPEAVWYGHVSRDDVGEIIERHILKGEVVQRLLMKEYASGISDLPPLDLPEGIAAHQEQLSMH